jgi:hypothetical protein
VRAGLITGDGEWVAVDIGTQPAPRPAASPDMSKPSAQRPIGAFIIGDEILSGKRRDAHLGHLIDTLRTRGLALGWALYLGDDRARLGDEFRRSMASDAVVFSFGGIGATPDDHTRQAAAAAAGLPIERHPGAVAEIEAQFGDAAYPKRVMMADLPRAAGLIPNPVNRVPGFFVGEHHFFPASPTWRGRCSTGCWRSATRSGAPSRRSSSPSGSLALARAS